MEVLAHKRCSKYPLHFFPAARTGSKTRLEKLVCQRVYLAKTLDFMILRGTFKPHTTLSKVRLQIS